MAYFSKQLLLKAYETIYTIHPAPESQGARQTISALKYFFALEMFYKKNNRPCDTSDKNDKKAFCSFVGNFVDVNERYFTSDFYYPLRLKSENSDYNVGSNFFSVNSVKNSRSNGGTIIQFPSRGKKPLIDIQNGMLIENKTLFTNYKLYIWNDPNIACAIAIWLVRNFEIDNNDLFISFKRNLEFIFPEDLAEIMLPKQTDFDLFIESIETVTQESKCIIEQSDITRLFTGTIPFIAEQTIYFGAPGTGKSFKIDSRNIESRKIAPVDNIIRTTFHPDTDYSSFVGCYKPVPREDKKELITYKFVPQCFTIAYVKAWERYIQPTEYNDPNFTLIIEEINRGNCAQIFGDIFQLLDRNEEDGCSQYAIKPDIDLSNYLAEQFSKILTEMDLKGYDKIATGEEMRLPPNLSIIATMNTSDQSLFPIDSAFKRRWDWEYIPINYSPTDIETGEKLSYKIHIDGDIFDWGSFIKAVNDHIYKLTHSEDKQLGYFFVRPFRGENITMKRFVSKVIFYLWSDIYKDYAGRNDSIFNFSEDGDENNKVEHSFNSFFENGFIQVNLVKKFIEQFVEKESSTSIVEFTEDRNKYNPTYNINGKGDYSARKLPSEVMRLYVRVYSEKTPEQVVEDWLSLGVNVSHFVETVEQYEERTDEKNRVERIEWEKGVVYVTTHGWVYSTNEQYKVSTILQFINAVNKKEWKDICLGVN